MSDFLPLDPLALPLRGRRLIEASAGTGKTWTLAALYLRLVLGHGENIFAEREIKPQDIPQKILVLTFTRAAAQELRSRIRARLAEAADVFAGLRATDDALLLHLLDAAGANYEAQALRLRVAAQNMDRAAIYTIHSFCQRALKRFAFAAGQAFELTLISDASSLRDQALKDYWRHFIQPLPTSLANALIAAKISTPAQLGGAIQKELGVTPAEPPVKTPFPLSIQRCADNLATLATTQQALQQTIAKALPDISIWLHEQLANKQLSGTKYKAEKLLGALAAFAEQGDIDEKGLSSLTRSSLETPENWNKKATPTLPTGHWPDDLEVFLAQWKDAAFPLADLLQHACDWVAAEQENQLSLQASITYDSMVIHLARALSANNSQPLADQLFAAYPCALIDEFQDTDTRQYRIFERIYANRRDDAFAWLMIGDPKQSIYGFRGADLGTYLEAARGAQRYTLDTNYRSTEGMVAAVNALFSTSPLEQSGGVFAAPEATAQIQFHEVKAHGQNEVFLLDGAPATALTLCQIPTEDKLASGAATTQLTEAFAARIAALLSKSQQGRAGFQRSNGELRPLQPADIACLVRDRKQAEALKQALKQRDVDAVFLSEKSSVYQSQTAQDLYRLLVGVAHPQEGQAVRQALTCDLLAYDSTTLARLIETDALWQQHLLHFRTFLHLWQQFGILPMLHQLVHTLDLPSRQRDERVLTDLFHLAELLQQASTQLDGREALLAHLETCIASDALGNDEHSDILLRLENERNRVILMTLHGAKGLEFPLVMLPYAGLAQKKSWEEEAADEMQLLYVGVTRARHALWLGLIDNYHGTSRAGVESSALGRLLFGSSPASVDAQQQRLKALCDTSHDHIGLEENVVTDDILALTHAALPALLPASALALPLRRPASWAVTSYSALTRRTAHGHFNATTERQLESGDDADDSAATTHATTLGIHQFPRGREAGNFLHLLLEKACRTGFARCDRDTLARLLTDAQSLNHWPDTQATLSDWLAQLLHTPLHFDGQTVALAHADTTLAETEFWLRLQQARTDELETLAARFLPGERQPLHAEQLNGMLKGFIDLLLRVGERYYVLDYKSNYLGASDDSYTQTAMEQAMLAHRYDLQSLLYQLALHRLLRSRLPDYDPARHLGGSLYFFLRGIGSASQGLLHQPAQIDLLDQLDQCFESRT